VRIFPIGFGTERGGMMDCSGLANFDDSFAGGGMGYGGGRFRRGIDEEALQRVAELTGGTYYAPESASELQQVFAELPTSTITRHEAREISVVFAAIGALLAACAIGLSMLWNPLP
jgi:Ca-activated chloride channel family protein